jgi:hypothetical protein
MPIMRSRATAVLFLFAVIGTTACGASTRKAGPAPQSAPETHGWSTTGFAQLESAKGRLRDAFPGACTTDFTYERADYVADDNQILKTLVPNAVGQCDVGTENLEISVFPNAATRDRFITQRMTALCTRAASRHIELMPIPWITYDSVAMQPDTAAGGQRIAAKLSGAQARVHSCPT